MKGGKFILLLVLGWVISGSVFAQNARVQLEFEDAEKCYNQQDFAGAIQHLDAVEKKAGVTSKTLYLRIMIENSQLKDSSVIYGSEQGFNSLTKLRTHAKQYLDGMSSEGLDDKYRAVYRVLDDLKAFPENKADWDLAQKSYLAQKAQQERTRQAIQQLAEAKKQRELAGKELALLNRHLITLEQLQYNELSQLLDSATATPPKAHCTIYFYREPKMMGRWVNFKIYINQQLAFPLATKTYKKALFSAGVLQLGGLHGTFKDREGKRSKKLYARSLKAVQLKKGRTYYIGCQMAKDGSIQFSVVSEYAAKNKIKDYEEMKATFDEKK